MRKSIVFIFGILFGAGICIARAPNDTTLHTLVLTSQYTPDVDYHGIFKSVGSKFLGIFVKIEPDTLTLVHTRIMRGDSEIAFSMRLIADRDSERKKDSAKTWVYISSDTTQESFTNLPLEKRKILHSDGVRYVRMLLPFFSCMQGCADSMVQSFHVDTSEIHAMFWADTAIQVHDASRIHFRGSSTRYLHGYTEDARKKIPYLWGDVLAEQKSGHAVYPYFFIHMAVKNIDVRLYLQSWHSEYR